MRIFTRPLLAASALAGAALIGGCTDGYGYSGVALGYGSPGYYGGYYDSAWGDPYWGWYGDYYYPGTGVYVYDRARRRHSWNDAQRGYWEGRRSGWQGNRTWRNNWHDFRRSGGGSWRRGRR
jgi:hypothetical protein